MRTATIAAFASITLVAGCASTGEELETQSDESLASTEQSLGSRFWDFGKTAEGILKTSVMSLFGVHSPLAQSAPATTGAFRTSTQTAAQQLLVAGGLSVKYVTRAAADLADMFAFWPDDMNPTHLVFCIEGGREVIGVNPDQSDKLNPAVQTVRIADGEVRTILRGMSRCDGIRRTPWGTLLATEEQDDGGAYEIINPLDLSNVVVTDRATGAISDPRVVKRPAMPTMAWEGLEVLPTGVVVAGDELRPGTGRADVDGGSIFKFVPTALRTSTTAVTSLEQSPLVSGQVFALQVSCVQGRQQFGQGCEVGAAAWIPVGAATARSDAAVQGATGYYRPEDLHLDPRFADTTNPAAVRYCWANTGNASSGNFAEVMCAVDRAPTTAAPTQQTVAVSRFIEGDEDFNAFDNLAFQNPSGNLYVIEDADNGDVFACLPDGADRDRKSDGCVKVMSVADSSAEPSGLAFTADGRRAFLAIQHSDDANMPLVDDYPTDDIVVIQGFQTFGLR